MQLYRDTSQRSLAATTGSTPPAPLLSFCCSLQHPLFNFQPASRHGSSPLRPTSAIQRRVSDSTATKRTSSIRPAKPMNDHTANMSTIVSAARRSSDPAAKTTATSAIGAALLAAAAACDTNGPTSIQAARRRSDPMPSGDASMTTSILSRPPSSPTFQAAMQRGDTEPSPDAAVKSASNLPAKLVSDPESSGDANKKYPSTPPAKYTSVSPTLLQSLHGPRLSGVGKLAEKIIDVEEKTIAAIQAFSMYDTVDVNRRGLISKLDLLKAIQEHAAVGDFVLPGLDCSNAVNNEKAFDAVSRIFISISNRKKRISRQEFAEFFRHRERNAQGLQEDRSIKTKSQAEEALDRAQLQIAFNLMDSDGDGIVSKLDFIHAVQHEHGVASLVLPGVDRASILNNSDGFDAVDEVFDKIAKGKKVIDFTNLVEHFCAKLVAKPCKVPVLQRTRGVLPRASQRVLLISPGFGRELTPQQCKMATQAGFQTQWLNVLNPEAPGFQMNQHLGAVKAAIDEYQPHLLACASKGGHYVMALWQSGLWRGATLMLNAHPNLKELPTGVPIVIAHGGNDELYTRSRTDLEQLISTGSPNMCFLYTSVDSGKVQGASGTRNGDRHTMDSLLSLDCLPRLMDAALSPPPEMQIMQSWQAMLGEDRLRAEEWLGYNPDKLRRLWASSDQRGMDSKKVHDVPPGSEEFRMVAAIFYSKSKERPFYESLTTPTHAAIWANTGILKIERVENGFQESGSAQPYYESLQRSIEDQGLAFEPGLHTRWAFHGTSAVESIISNPIAGFQPLTSGNRIGAVWGYGTYFARDAKYVVDAGFCKKEADGTHRMLMCLLMTGMSCVGDPHNPGMLPLRQKFHRYNSSVDSLSSPEIYIMQHPSSAHPAYVITFRN